MFNELKKTISNKKNWFILIPFLYVVVFLVHSKVTGPFSGSRIDPEYLYLLNGLNIANGQPGLIGHIDNPGTPFQVLTGIFLFIVHLFYGSGDITTDVLANPDLYLYGCNILFTLLASIVGFWVAIKIYSATQNFLISFLTGGLLLLFETSLHFFQRYMPDELLILLAQLMAVPVFQLLFTNSYSKKRFSIVTGIFAGIGVITKLNFLPLTILPLLLVNKLKNKLLYIGIFLLSAFISFLPIIRKHAEVRHWIINLVSHDGIYGSGNEQFINVMNLWSNFKIHAQQNVWTLLIFGLAISFLFYDKFSEKKIPQKKYRFVKRYVWTYLIVFLFGLILILKHYKGYYFAPLSVLSVITFMVIWQKIQTSTHKKNLLNNTMYLLASLQIVTTIIHEINFYTDTKKLKIEKEKEMHWVENHVNKQNWEIIEPTWHYGVTTSQGLIFGISYVANKFEYFQDYQLIYPLTLSWEGPEKKLSYFRMLPYLPDRIIYSGMGINLFQTKETKATHEIMEYILNESKAKGILFKADTIYKNHYLNEQIIELKNKSPWHIKQKFDTNFETLTPLEISSTNGINHMTGNPYLLANESGTKNKILVLSGLFRESPSIHLSGLKANDLLSIQYIIRGDSLSTDSLFQTLTINKLRVSDSTKFVAHYTWHPIHKHWKFIQIGIRIKDSSTTNAEIRLCNPIQKDLFFDNLSVWHMSEQTTKTTLY